MAHISGKIINTLERDEMLDHYCAPVSSFLPWIFCIQKINVANHVIKGTRCKGVIIAM